MKISLTDVFSELELVLAELKQTVEDKVEYATQALELTEQYLSLVEEQLHTYEFASEEEEMNYFKQSFPSFFRLYFYYQSIVKMENEHYFQCFTKAQSIAFYEEYKQRFETVHPSDMNLLHQARTVASTDQKNLFLRKYARWRRLHLSEALHETYTTNSVSIALGKRASLDDLLHYIDHELEILQDSTPTTRSTCSTCCSSTTSTSETTSSTALPPPPASPSLQWTGTKIQLMELIYALSMTRYINDGRITLHELVACFEEFFHLELNHNNSMVQNIKERKKNKTILIDTLREQLNHKLID